MIRLGSMTPILAYPSGREISATAWMRLFQHGVQDVIEAPQDQMPAEIAYRIINIGGLSHNQVIDSLAECGVPDHWLRFFRKAFLHAHRQLDQGEPSLSASRMATLWMPGARDHQLQDALRSQGLPPAGWIARWLIVLRAVTMKPVANTWKCVAVDLGFEDQRHFRRFVRRLTDLPPTDLDTELLISLFRIHMDGGRHRALRAQEDRQLR